MTEFLPLFMFVVLFMLLALGYPVAFTLAGTSILFAGLGSYLEIFYWTDLSFIAEKTWAIAENFTLAAVPLFVFMGLVLEGSKISADLLTTIDSLLQRYRSGLALGVILVCAIWAASTGIVGATVTTMGVLSLPAMLKQGYDKRLACGTIVSSGSLGLIVPPSILLVFLGDVIQIDVGDLFVGAMVPGMLLIAMYLIYVTILIKLRPSLGRTTDQDVAPQVTKRDVITSVLNPILLVLIVLGSIFLGLASPTEAAGCGAFGAAMMALAKGRLSRTLLMDVGARTAKISAMVVAILIGAQLFGIVFRGLEGDELIKTLITESGLSRIWVLLLVMALVFALGFFLDFFEICFIIIPIVLPILQELEFNTLWVAILFAINLQTSYLTPPFGFSLFYLKGVAPPGISSMDIYRGAAPFVVIHVILMFIVAYWPQMVLWLPGLVWK